MRGAGKGRVWGCEKQGGEQGSGGGDSCKVVGGVARSRGGSREGLGVRAVGGGCGAVK